MDLIVSETTHLCADSSHCLAPLPKSLCHKGSIHSLIFIPGYQKTIKHTKPIVYIPIVFDSSTDAGHELLLLIKANSIFALVLTESYFGG